MRRRYHGHGDAGGGGGSARRRTKAPPPDMMQETRSPASANNGPRRAHEIQVTPLRAEALGRALPGRAEGGGGLEAETRNWEPVRRDGRIGAAAEAPEAQPARKPPGG